jgi:hypothetical protein
MCWKGAPFTRLYNLPKAQTNKQDLPLKKIIWFHPFQRKTYVKLNNIYIYIYLSSIKDDN